MKLPQKEYFFLPELAEEWRCTVEDLLHYAIRDQLEIGALLSDQLLFGTGDDREILGAYLVTGILIPPIICFTEWEREKDTPQKIGGLTVQPEYRPEITEASYMDPDCLGRPLIGWKKGRDWDHPEMDLSKLSRFLTGRDSMIQIGIESLVVHRIEKKCFELSSESLPLKDAVNLVVGAPEEAPMNTSNPAWTLWQAALSANKHWPVRDCKRDGERFVHIDDFLQWAGSEQFTLPVGVKLWTPDDLVAERTRLENARNRDGCSLKELDEATRRIRWANELLHRFAEVGITSPSQRHPIREELSISDERARDARLDYISGSGIGGEPKAPIDDPERQYGEGKKFGGFGKGGTIAQRSIGAQEFLRLLGSQLRYGDSADNPHNEVFRVTDQGVSLWPLRPRDWDLMTSQEQEGWREQEHIARLDFPCSVSEVVAWVELQGEGFTLDSKLLKQLAPEQEESCIEQATGSSQTASRTRKTRLVKAIEAALERLRKKLKREPTASEVFDFLAEEDDTDTIEDYKENVLVWRDTKGTLHDTQRKTFENSLSRIRARGD
jgi:hypothetical protein